MLMNQVIEEERKAKPVPKISKQRLSQTKIEKYEAEEIAQSVSFYRDQIKRQIISCLKEEREPISILEMLANYKELGTINQLSLEEIVKELVQKGQAVAIEDEYPIKYRLKR